MVMLSSIARWLKDFAKHYKDHKVDFEVTESGSRITIAVELKDIPEETLREIVEKLNEAISIMSRGKLPLSVFGLDLNSIREKGRMLLKRTKKLKNNPLHTGVIV